MYIAFGMERVYHICNERKEYERKKEVFVLNAYLLG